MSRPKPRVHLLTTGGTVANPRDEPGYLPGRELLDDVPEVEEHADVAVTDVASVGSQEMTPRIWYRLHEEITDLATGDAPPDGVVITHGSNTVEETAYFLHLTLDVRLPVVCTAAQRNHRLIGNDGDRNLLDAVRVAGHPDARDRGAMVVVNDEIHSARDVTKVVSSRPDAWSSGNLGVLGLLDKRDNMAFYRRSQRDHTADTELTATGDPESFPNVEVVYATAGDDGSMARAAMEADADGIVLAATPTGAPADPAEGSSQADVFEEIQEAGIPTVLSHRGFEGWPYPREGFIWGDTLTPQKAGILLACSLLETDDHERIQGFFERY